MHKVARQKALLGLLSEQGQLGVAELARTLRVSVDTVRRDLNDLQRQGLAQKNHGGAIALDVPAMSRNARSGVLNATKQRLGRAVAQQIPPGSTLMLDAGSTVLAVAAALTVPARVITASLDIAWALSGRADIELILLGGQWDNSQRLFAGAATLAALQRYRADIAIFGACAVDARLGISASQEADAEIKRAMLAFSAQRWLVVDHLKLDRCQPHRVADLADMQRLFIDRPWNALPAMPSTDVSVIAEGEQHE
ncbi:MAG: DeoR/GlpR family DNA-binding transcription regulator [Mixta calida]|uniref:DeoR/GlpR transcriptional regulator n=1 Tax=Mixta calida TaxID=665913 RepID=A0ABN5H7J1_9GAMM|nr:MULTISPECIES: DeoR/GlpR family DNA-binding transcription regulator [Mixta]AIX74493.1 DeoR faimly transcriptional regulator [Pantoea sp. PSNIH2]MBS6056541.1 DeoR/GlpR transcriptional regulator [Pantoea sp.]POU51070.1 DeoR/GlpR transcriptional regulator [Pantoea sp. PSNIH5]POU68905.1 DeoR/GlpR transcriptional regulator [Pantoea sp. PSNIH4]POY65518.1 DeoR/GlpR transcriptional regulator [Pantoea sp. PSNIH3]HCW48094.1 DeoR/GlpR transcriptional regulator [Erwiniaceae bacterium]